MPTSPRKFAHSPEAGFSLMEILVVLAIMGLMLSVVSVRLVSTLGSTYFSKTADAAMADILMVRADAILTGEARIIITDATRLQQFSDSQKKIVRRFNVPEGWRVSGNQIQISRTGTCFGGAVAIEDGEGRLASYTLTPPKCESVRSSTLAED